MKNPYPIQTFNVYALELHPDDGPEFLQRPEDSTPATVDAVSLVEAVYVLKRLGHRGKFIIAGPAVGHSTTGIGVADLVIIKDDEVIEYEGGDFPTEEQLAPFRTAEDESLPSVS